MLWKTHNYVLDPIFQKFSKCCLSNSIGVCLIDDDDCRPKAEHQTPSVSKPISPPGIQWCDVLGFVSAGSVSSPSTLQVFQDSTSPALTNLGCWEVREVNTSSMMGWNFPAWVQVTAFMLAHPGMAASRVAQESGSWHFH